MRTLFLGLALTSALLAQAPIGAAETGKLLFQAAPLRGGSVGQQISGAVKDLSKAGQPVKVRVFVTAGTSLDAVTAAIQKAFPVKARPVVNLVQIARLPDPAASVLVEGFLVSTKVENPSGVAFLSGQLTQAESGAVAQLAERSVSGLKTVAEGIEVSPADVVRVNCFTSSLGDSAQVRAAVSETFPNADVSVMQIQRSPANSFVECDAVARLHAKPADGVRLINPTQAAFAQAAIVNAPRMIFTTTYTSSGDDDAGVRAALAKMRDALQGNKITMDHVFYLYAYPGSQAMLDKFRALRFEVLMRSNPPASTNLVFEGAAGTMLGIDAIAW